MPRLPLRRGVAAVAVLTATLTARGATAQRADEGLQPRDIAARAQASLLVVRAIGPHGDTVGEGTGFVVAAGGTFVTNYHIVEPAAKVEVEPLGGGTTREVLLLAADPHRDLAVLRAPDISAGQLPLGDDSLAVIGDRIYVMGNPLGLSGTFSDGLVSARRPLHGTAMLQISAPISPGSSGGPVMNERGEVIGVATMMVVGGQNLSLAVPTRYVRPLLVSTDAPRPFSAAALPRRESRPLLTAASRGPGPGEAWRQQVLRQIQTADSVLRRNGLQLEGPVQVGSARQGQRRVEEITLEAGVRYFVIARCDFDCSNVDLRLIDQAGHVLARDDAADDFPAVTIVARGGGAYRAEVRMARCSAEPCAYAVAVFRADRPQLAAGGR